MQYALLIYEDHSIYGDDETGPEWQQIVQKHIAFSEEYAEKIRGGEGLKGPDQATTVRRSGANAEIHDGPYAEAREQLGGFYVVEAAGLDEALSIARKIPLLSRGSIEVRPTLSPPA